MALVLGVGAATAACGGGSGPKPVSLKATGGAAPGGAAGTAGATSGTPATAGGGGSATTSAPAGAPATTAHPSTTSPATTTVATTSPKTTTPAASSGPAPAAPGTYTYNLDTAYQHVAAVTGGTTSTTAVAVPVPSSYTLGVSQTGSGTEQLVGPNATTTLQFTDAGVFLEAETLTPPAPIGAVPCSFSRAVALPPWPLATGKAFSGPASCQGGYTLSLSGQVGSQTSVTVGGVSVPTFVVTSELSGAGVTINETDWYAPSLRLPVMTTMVVGATLDGFTYDSSTTYLLASTRPS